MIPKRRSVLTKLALADPAATYIDRKFGGK
jgi:hypothetical protein